MVACRLSLITMGNYSTLGRWARARVLRPELAITPDGDVRRRTVANCANDPTVRRRSPTVIAVLRRSQTSSTVADWLLCRSPRVSVHQRPTLTTAGPQWLGSLPIAVGCLGALFVHSLDLVVMSRCPWVQLFKHVEHICYAEEDATERTYRSRAIPRQWSTQIYGLSNMTHW